MSVQSLTIQFGIIYLNCQEHEKEVKTWLFIMVEKLGLLEKR